MPVATILQLTEKRELKTLEGGYVVVRRMNFGEKLTQQENMMKMSMEKGTGGDPQMDIELLQRRSALWEFANLIMEHNLTDSNDLPLNFKLESHVTSLDPRIGSEIQDIINSVNSFEDSIEGKA